MNEMTSETPVTVLPELERMLVLQASLRMRTPVGVPGVETATPAIAPARVRRLRLSRRSSALALLVAVVVGSAVAATSPWSPLLGNEHAGHPTVSSSSPGAAALRMLGVLRRAQTQQDRDSQTAAVLRIVGPQLHGVKVDWIRNLEANVAGRAVTLVPVETYGDSDEATPVPREGGFLCVLYPFGGPDPGVSSSCWSPAQIAGGGAVGLTREEGSAHVFGLVPDGVASVTVELAGGQRASAAVSGNFFDAAEPSSRPSRVLSLGWRDRAGREIGPTPAQSAKRSGRGVR